MLRAASGAQAGDGSPARAPATRPREEDATVATASVKPSAALLREASAFRWPLTSTSSPQAAALKAMAHGLALVHGDDEKERKTWFRASRT